MVALGQLCSQRDPLLVLLAIALVDPAVAIVRSVPGTLDDHLVIAMFVLLKRRQNLHC